MKITPINAGIVLAVLIAVGTAIYANSFQAAFHYDDQRIIVQNDLLKNPLDIQSVWNFDPSRFFPNWTFAANYKFSRHDVRSYHAVSLFFHILTSFAVFLLIRITFITPALKNNVLSEKKNPIAVFSALLFLCHTVQTQAVVYIVQRSAVMAACFYILTLYFFAKSAVTGKYRYFLISLITAGIATFSKQTAFTLPFAVILYYSVFLKSGKTSAGFRLLPLYFIPLAAAFFLIYAKPAAAFGIGKILNVKSGLTHAEYLLTQINVFRTYFRLLFVPVNLNLDYDYPVSRSFAEASTLLSFLLIITAAGLGYWFLKKHKLMAFGIFWFFLTLSIESGIANIHDVIYEHRLYLPMFGFVCLIVPLLFYVLPKNLSAVILIVGITALSLMTFQRNKIWATEVSLWEDVVQKSPAKGRVHYALANAYMSSWQPGSDSRQLLDKAVYHYEKAVELKLPQFGAALNGLGIALVFRGDLKKGMDYFREALRINPADEVASKNIKLVENLILLPESEQARILKKLNFAYGFSYLHKTASAEQHSVSSSNNVLSGSKTVTAAPVNPDGSARDDTVYTLQVNLGKEGTLIAVPVSSEGATSPATVFTLEKDLGKGEKLVSTPVGASGERLNITTDSIQKN